MDTMRRLRVIWANTQCTKMVTFWFEAAVVPTALESFQIRLARCTVCMPNVIAIVCSVYIKLATDSAQICDAMKLNGCNRGLWPAINDVRPTYAFRISLVWVM